MKKIYIIFGVVSIIISAVLGYFLYTSVTKDDTSSSTTETIQDDQTASNQPTQPSDQANGNQSNDSASQSVAADLARYTARVSEYVANNNGRLPETLDILITEGYFETSPISPLTDSAYTYTIETPAIGQIQYRQGFRCDQNNELVPSSSSRVFAVRTRLSESQILCQSND